MDKREVLNWIGGAAYTYSLMSQSPNSAGPVVFGELFFEEASGTTGQVKVWNGSWVAKPAKVWNGSSWATKPAKTWNGTSWITTAY